MLVPPDGEEAPALEIFVFHRTGYITTNMFIFYDNEDPFTYS